MYVFIIRWKYKDNSRVFEDVVRARTQEHAVAVFELCPVTEQIVSVKEK